VSCVLGRGLYRVAWMTPWTFGFAEVQTKPAFAGTTAGRFRRVSPSRHSRERGLRFYFGEAEHPETSAPYLAIHASNRGLACAFAALPLYLYAGTAAAHSGTGLSGGFGAGFAHPFGGGDHLLAMVCVGAWGAQLGAPLRLALPFTFPLMMVAGAALALWGLPMAAVESGIALSVLALGACIACRWRAPVWAACALVAGFALLHGYAHGRELPVAADPAGYSLGFVLATGLLHVLGIGIGELGVRVSGAALRGFGAAVAAVGAGFLYSALSA